MSRGLVPEEKFSGYKCWADCLGLKEIEKGLFLILRKGLMKHLGSCH